MPSKPYTNGLFPDVESHVVAIDTEVKGLGREMGEMRGEMGTLRNTVSNGFSELHRLIASRNQVNWAVVIAACMLLLAAIGYLQVSFLKPLLVTDEAHAKRLDLLEHRQWLLHEQTIRNDERLKSSPFAR